MKKIILLFLIVNTLNSQSFTDLTEQNLYRGGNVFLLDKMNNYDEALRYIRESLNIDSSNETIQEHLNEIIKVKAKTNGQVIQQVENQD